MTYRECSSFAILSRDETQFERVFPTSCLSEKFAEIVRGIVDYSTWPSTDAWLIGENSRIRVRLQREVRLLPRIHGNLRRNGDDGGEARLLMGRVGVRVDILPALCHRRDVGGDGVKDG